MAKFAAATKNDAQAKLGARLDTLDAFLDGADVCDVMQVCAYVVARASPDCCDQHLEAEFLRLAREDQHRDEAESGDEAPVRH
jgi:hypothetical protein